MKKIIIISYFFPPSHFVGGERILFWAKNLHINNIYPIIITRCWNDNQKDIIGRVKNNIAREEKYKDYEIHYLPYRHQLRDYFSESPFVRKALTLIYQILFHIYPSSINYINFFKKAETLITESPEIKTVIISGKPFESFYIGYRLKKKFENINWIPDYRDEWNTFQDKKTKGSIIKFLSILERRAEKKFTSNARLFITTSKIWANRIKTSINKDYIIVQNGFVGNIKNNLNTTVNHLKIIYAGSLHPNQKIEPFLEIVSEINKRENNFIIIEFIGSEMVPGQLGRLKKIKKNHIGNLDIISKQTKEDLNAKILKADLLYLTSFENVKGWLPVKIFEYSKYLSPIVLYPSDKGYMEKFISTTNSGYFFNNSKELKESLIRFIKIKKSGEAISCERNLEEIKKYSRSNQTKILGEYLNDYIN